VYHRKTREKETSFLQLLLPRSEVKSAIRHCHAGSVGGHFGIEKTLAQIEQRFFWHELKDNIKRYCRKCEQCARYHRGKLPKQGVLKPVLAGIPYERWYLDLTGPQPKSEHGNVFWILTCMDLFSKSAEAFPLSNKEAESIARVLVQHVFTRFGAPLSILSDQGKEVDGRVMREACRLFGIEKLCTTPYKPSTNQVERFHRTMNSILAKTDWDVRLPFAMAAYRTSKHKARGYSPNKLVLGRETLGPPDIVFGNPGEESISSYDGHVEQVWD